MGGISGSHSAQQPHVTSILICSFPKLDARCTFYCIFICILLCIN
uniref:Uncharacterized protein n=1 Tax=Anguilla anguilla TaxID=7936 RepID=A0A0E9QLU1_ANGAN